MIWWEDAENPVHRRKCPLCGYANDPEVYAMIKRGKKWYHEICLRIALSYFLKHYDFKVSYKKLKPIYCVKKSKQKLTNLSDEETQELFRWLEGERKCSLKH